MEKKREWHGETKFTRMVSVRLPLAEWEKLKAYEDLGLDPEEYERALSADIMVRVAAVALGVPAEALRDMVELGKAGRLMVLPEEGESDG